MPKSSSKLTQRLLAVASCMSDKLFGDLTTSAVLLLEEVSLSRVAFVLVCRLGSVIHSLRATNFKTCCNMSR